MEKDKETRFHACKAIGNLGPKAAKAVPALIKAMKMTDYSLTSTIKALGQIGPQAKAAVPALIEVVESTNSRGRVEAVKALGNIGDKRAVGPLQEALKRATVVYVKNEISEALEKIEGKKNP